MKSVTMLAGSWDAIPEESAEVGRFGAGRMEIETNNDEIVLRRIARGARITDTITCRLDGEPLTARPAQRIIPDLFTSGIYRAMDTDRTVSGAVTDDGFLISESLTLTSSQGKSPAQFDYLLESVDNGERLRLTFTRSTVPNDPGTLYMFRRSEMTYAYSMELGSNWEVKGDLSKHALLISLQALANRNSPRLYFVYPEDWDFKFTPAVLEYLRNPNLRLS